VISSSFSFSFSFSFSNLASSHPPPHPACPAQTPSPHGCNARAPPLALRGAT
jgi:hypothetical protein